MWCSRSVKRVGWTWPQKYLTHESSDILLNLASQVMMRWTVWELFQFSGKTSHHPKHNTKWPASTAEKERMALHTRSTIKTHLRGQQFQHFSGRGIKDLTCVGWTKAGKGNITEECMVTGRYEGYDRKCFGYGFAQAPLAHNLQSMPEGTHANPEGTDKEKDR